MTHPGYDHNAEREETMLDSSITLRGPQREIIDYMRDVYRIDDIKVRPGGKHLHIEYVYEGRRHKDTLPRGKGGDPNWISVRKHDLRKELGEPPPPDQPAKRKLDDMTQEVQAKADLLTSTAIGSVIGTGKTAPPPAPLHRHTTACTIGTSRNSSDLSFYLTKELALAMEKQFGKGRRYVATYHYPSTWTVRPSRDSGRAIEMGNHRLRVAGTEAIKRLGRFASTKAQAVLHHNRIEFHLEEMPVVDQQPAGTGSIARPDTPMSPRKAALETERQAYIAEPVVDAPVAPVAIPVAPVVAPPVDPRERLRDVLRQIKQIEGEGYYRLIPDNDGWRWRANDIVLEQE